MIVVLTDARATAIEAYDRFRKARHPADFNFGECFGYACALPPRYKGDEFSY